MRRLSGRRRLVRLARGASLATGIALLVGIALQAAAYALRADPGGRLAIAGDNAIAAAAACGLLLAALRSPVRQALRGRAGGALLAAGAFAGAAATRVHAGRFALDETAIALLAALAVWLAVRSGSATRARRAVAEPAGLARVASGFAIFWFGLLVLRTIAPGTLVAVALAALVGLVGPGLAIGRHLLPAEAGWPERLAFAPALGAAIQVLALLWASFAGVRAGPTMMFAATGAFLVAGLLPLEPRTALLIRERLHAGPWAGLAAAVTLWVSFLTWRWLSLDRGMVFWDPAYHLMRAVDFLRAPLRYLTDPTVAFQPPYSYPPVGHAVLGILYGLTGYDLDLTVAAYNLGFLVVLIASTYLIGRELHSREVGGLAAAFLALYPEVFIRLRWPLLDLPLAAMSAATVFAIVRTRGFQDARWSVAAGFLLGLGQLTKHVHVLALAGPALFTLWRSGRDRTVVRNAGLAALTAGAIALPWWIPQLSYYLEVWVPGQVAYATAFQSVPAFSVVSIAYFSLGIWSLTSFVFAALWLSTLGRFLRLPSRGVVLSWWIGCYLLLTAMANKNVRYGEILLPAVALMTAAGLSSWRFGRPVALAAIGFGLLQSWAMSFGLAWLPAGTPHHPVTLAEPIQILTQHSHVEQGFWPDPGGWGLAETFSRLRGRVGVVDPGLNPDPYRTAFLSEAIEIEHLPERARGQKAVQVERLDCDHPGAFRAFDLLVVPVGGERSPFYWLPRGESCFRGFRVVAEVPVRRGPGRSPDDFMGIEAVRLLEPIRDAPVSAPGAPAVSLAAPGPGGLIFSDINVQVGPGRVEAVRAVVYNPLDEPALVNLSYHVAMPGVDPFADYRYRSQPREVVVPPRSAKTIEFPRSSALDEGRHVVALSLFRFAEATGKWIPCHWGHSEVVITRAEGRRKP